MCDSVYRISNAHRLSKMELLREYGTSGTYSLFSLTSTYFGDPIISLPIPDKPDLSIASSDIKIIPGFPGDDLKSVELQIKIKNFGKVATDSLTIVISDKYSDSEIFQKTDRIAMPMFITSLSVSIPVYRLPGTHLIKITIDPENRLSELNEENNNYSQEIYVSNSNLRLMNIYKDEAAVSDTLKILFPIYFPGNSSIDLELSSDENFSNIKNISSSNTDVIANINLAEKIPPGRWWVRGRRQHEDFFSFIKSFFMGSDYKYYLMDSASFRNVELTNLQIKNNKIVSDSLTTRFSAISAGYNDGKTAVISKNGETYIPAGNLIGHHVCVFRDRTFEFVDYKRFNVFGGETGEYYKYLDTLSSQYLVLIAVSDEGRVPDSRMRKLHEFGSIYIDSLRFRSSWALIGKRGAPGGSVPESYSNPYEGKVQIDTTFNYSNQSGFFVTSLIGPAAKWEELSIIAKGKELKICPIVYDHDFQPDTLENIYSGNDLMNIYNYVPGNCNYLKFKVQMESGNEISSLGVKYQGAAELLTNNIQSFLEKDTITAGEELKLRIKIFNAGDSPSGEFDLLLEITNMTGGKDTLSLNRIASLFPGEFVIVDTAFKYVNNGLNNLKIVIDSREEVKELYEDNNLLQIPFFINSAKINPSVKILFDEVEVFDGDYVGLES